MSMDDGAANDGPGYRLILSFPDQSPSFAFGFTAGQIWAEMKRNEQAELCFDVAAENREIVYRMAESLGWEVECQPMAGEFDGWDSITLSKVGPGRENPHGLRVIR